MTGNPVREDDESILVLEAAKKVLEVTVGDDSGVEEDRGYPTIEMRDTRQPAREVRF